MKRVWLTSVDRSEEKVRDLIPKLRSYGLEASGHFWEDDLEKMAWIGPREELIRPEVTLWLVLASAESLQSPSIRYGLSLLASTVQAKKGASFPIVLLVERGEIPSPDSLPTPLKAADRLAHADPAMGAKLVARVHSPAKAVAPEYRFDAYGNSQIGQWFEVGPRESAWAGAMFGLSEGEILFHGVGPKGMLPSRSVLNYPSRGLRLNLGGKEYSAWSVRNEVGSGTSYFVKVSGNPASVLFGPFPEEDQGEVYVVTLK